MRVQNTVQRIENDRTHLSRKRDSGNYDKRATTIMHQEYTTPLPHIFAQVH